MTQLATPLDAIPLVCKQTDDLTTVVRRIASSSQRQSLYAEILARRNRADPIINAFEARREACPDKVSEPLNGLPITVKDQIAVAGWSTSYGLERPGSKVEERSATLVSRLQELGACVTGKTALPPYAMDFQTGNKRRGPTSNPYNPKFTTGGSTGGGAAAVASGMSLLDVGSDLGGSLRIPAGWCGVTSYTPSEGFWPNDGMLRGSLKLAHFARVGLTARTASDLSFIWNMLEPNGNHTIEPANPPGIVLWKPDEPTMCDEDMLQCWNRFSKTVSAIHPKTSSDPMKALFVPDVYRLAGEIIGHETGAMVSWLIRWIMRRDRQARETSPGFVAHVHEGYKRNGARYEANLKSLAGLRANALSVWKEVDALLLPVSGVCAFEHISPLRDNNGVRTYDRVFETVGGTIGYFDALTRFTLSLTALGWPVVALPIGRDSQGIPVGAQLIGKPGDDGKILELARQVEQWVR